MTTSGITFPGPIQHLRSTRAAARPGDGTIRWPLDGEWFINQADMVACLLDASGRLRSFQLVDALAFPSWLAAMIPTLPTSDPGILNAPWNNNGALFISGYGPTS